MMSVAGTLAELCGHVLHVCMSAGIKQAACNVLVGRALYGWFFPTAHDVAH
jgi:hypothetical protein